MVITVHCTSCSTAFPVDTNKVPEGGVYARCSECAGVFFVERPKEERVTVPLAEAGAQPFQPPASSIAATEERDDYSSGWREPPAATEEGLDSDPWRVGAGSTMDSDPWSEPSYDSYEVSGDAGSGLQDPLVEAAEDAGEGLDGWAPRDTLFVPEVPPHWDTAVAEEGEPAREDVVVPVAEEPRIVEPTTAPSHETDAEVEVEVYPPAPVASDAWRDAIEEPSTDSYEITEVFQETVYEAAPAASEAVTLDAPATAPPFEPAPTAPPAHEPPVTEPPAAEPSVAESIEPEPPAAAPSSWPPPPEPPKAPVTSAPSAPATSFSFGRRDPHEKARRLARVLVSDMIMYNPERHTRAIQSGSIREDFDDEIRKSWQEYVDQVGDEIANSTSYFDDALNEILARGQRVFP